MFSIYQYLFYERMNSEDLKEIMENVFELPYDEIEELICMAEASKK